MARPKKQTVDYFPLYVNDSRTLRIVRRQYGNDGKAFWVTMLQILGRTEGHVYDYNKAADWFDLVTETDVTEEKAKEILETLATLGMIDKELWKEKIIWVQHFVDEHVALYTRRKVELPCRPSSLPVKPDDVPAAGDDLKVAGMIKYFEDEAKRMLTPNDFKSIVDFADNYPDGWFEKAVDEAVSNNAKAPIRYIEKILESWKEEGANPLGERPRRGRAAKVSDTSTEALEDSTTKPMPD